MSIIRWLEKREINKAHVSAMKEAALLQELEVIKIKHSEIINEMTSRPCAINNMDNCNDKCVHLYGGYIGTFVFDGERYATDRQPKCKLWRE